MKKLLVLLLVSCTLGMLADNEDQLENKVDLIVKKAEETGIITGANKVKFKQALDNRLENLAIGESELTVEEGVEALELAGEFMDMYQDKEPFMDMSEDKGETPFIGMDAYKQDAVNNFKAALKKNMGPKALARLAQNDVNDVTLVAFLK